MPCIRPCFNNDTYFFLAESFFMWFGTSFEEENIPYYWKMATSTRPLKHPINTHLQNILSKSKLYSIKIQAVIFWLLGLNPVNCWSYFFNLLLFIITLVASLPSLIPMYISYIPLPITFLLYSFLYINPFFIFNYSYSILNFFSHYKFLKNQYFKLS